MNYGMTSPCNECPFLKGSGFTMRSLRAHASGQFACHKQCKVDDESGDYVPRDAKTNHCAGALIFLEKRGESHQMMRICERLGFYDHTKLDMKANVR